MAAFSGGVADGAAWRSHRIERKPYFRRRGPKSRERFEGICRLMDSEIASGHHRRPLALAASNSEVQGGE
jgi:hypothetical protein